MIELVLEHYMPEVQVVNRLVKGKPPVRYLESLRGRRSYPHPFSHAFVSYLTKWKARAITRGMDPALARRRAESIGHK